MNSLYSESSASELVRDILSSTNYTDVHQRILEEDDDDKDGNDGLAKFSAAMSNIFLFFLIFGMSATVDVRNLKKQLTNKFAISIGVAMQYLIMPILGCLSVIIFRDLGFSEPMGITLLVVTASPGGSYSNWWCSTFNAELALSVAMTTVSSLLSVAFLPANLFLYTYFAYGVRKDGSSDSSSVIKALDFGTLFITLGIVLGAIITGLAAGYKWDNAKFHLAANKLGSVCGLLLIIFSVFLSSGGDGAESNFWTQPWAFYVGTLLPCLAGIVLANIISQSLRLKPPETVAIAIECCYQNTGIATSVAITMFKNPNDRAQAVAVPLFYGVIEAVIIGIYCVYAWKIGWTKAPADENICTVITKSYEVEEHGNDEVAGLPTDDALPAGQDLELQKDNFAVHKRSVKMDDSYSTPKKEDGMEQRPLTSDFTSETVVSSEQGSPRDSLEGDANENGDADESFEAVLSQHEQIASNAAGSPQASTNNLDDEEDESNKRGKDLL